MSTPSPRFLLDENVRVELSDFLKSKALNVRLAPRSTDDSLIANISKKEKRVLITNDWDFLEYTDDKIFAIVWLRIAQNDPETLVDSFENLLKEFKKFSGRLIVLKPGKWDDFALGKKIQFKN